MATKAKEIKKMLDNWNTSGTNSKADPQFQLFVKKFKSFMKNELSKVGATNIVFSIGHYYISGFFTVKEQPYYFSISDVRGMVMGNKLLYRTAKDYKDYSGGLNRWVEIEDGMFEYAREWGNI